MRCMHIKSSIEFSVRTYLMSSLLSVHQSTIFAFFSVWLRFGSISKMVVMFDEHWVIQGEIVKHLCFNSNRFENMIQNILLTYGPVLFVQFFRSVSHRGGHRFTSIEHSKTGQCWFSIGCDLFCQREIKIGHHL